MPRSVESNVPPQAGSATEPKRKVWIAVVITFVVVLAIGVVGVRVLTADTQTLKSADGTVSIEVPESWSPGELLGETLVHAIDPTQMRRVFVTPQPPTAPLSELLQRRTSVVAGAGPDGRIIDPGRSIEIAGYAAIQAEVSVTLPQAVPSAHILTLVDAGKWVYSVHVVTELRTFTADRESLKAIADSLKISLP